jgi:hypothetical protein
MPDPFWSLLAPIVAPAPLIHADQNGPRPPKPYATLDITSTGAAPWLVEHAPGVDGVSTFTEHRTANVEVQFYGDGAQARAAALGLRLRLPTQVDRATALGIGIGTVRGASSLAVLMNETQYESRSVVEFTAHVTASAEDTVSGAIDDIEIEWPDVGSADTGNSVSRTAPSRAFIRAAAFEAPPPTTA